MALLLEALSVYIKNEKINECFGSIEDFVENAPNKTVCFDNYLSRIAKESEEYFKMQKPPQRGTA